MTITAAEFQYLRDRVNRFRLIVEAKAHLGYTETHTLLDGSEHTYRIRGIKSPNQLEDEILSLFIWIWSMKDYLKELARARGTEPKLIEKIADSELSLGISADIANRAKHGYLRKSRSGRFSRLANVGFTIPGTAIGRIVIGAFDVSLHVRLPDSASLHASIEFETSDPPLDAFSVIEEAMKAWEIYAFPIAGI
jgi:hypothetical protein